jgi:hypothetical protein
MNYCFAAAPSQNKLTISDLKIHWDKESSPLALSLISRNQIVYPGNDTSNVSLKRIKYLGEKIQLIYIAKDPTKAPLIIDIRDSQNLISIRRNDLKDVSQDELWLWGKTQVSHCGSTNDHSSYNARFINNKKIKKTLSGLFIWKLKKKEMKNKMLLNFTAINNVDWPKSLTSKIISPASDLNKKRCSQWYGDKCDLIFELDDDHWGQRVEIIFLKSASPLKVISCPV